ncbi:hypothetical protein CEXT_296161 [Caerostris extrusa]|uniref:Uncharacterized protein n=1 Tax=Caerostris extrusa TaxID=172846 RepID=A0AAV4X467_CAEEX|nr:hypothetical protein CEXT_296161 [Caerostris extrusa]
MSEDSRPKFTCYNVCSRKDVEKNSKEGFIQPINWCMRIMEPFSKERDSFRIFSRPEKRGKSASAIVRQRDAKGVPLLASLQAALFGNFLGPGPTPGQKDAPRHDPSLAISLLMRPVTGHPLKADSATFCNRLFVDRQMAIARIPDDQCTPIQTAARIFAQC